MNGEQEHSDRARAIVRDYYNSRAEKTDAARLTAEDVYVVWFCYILGGWKALLTTSVVDGMYYEVTYDRPKLRTYLDAYKKWENVCVDCEEEKRSST